MAYNITDEYFKRLTTSYNAYFRLILEHRYNKQISDRLMEVFVHIRYGMAEYTSRGQSIKNKVMIELKEKKAKLLEEFPGKERDIEEMYIFSSFVIDFDNFTNDKYLEYLRELKEKRLKENKGKRYLKSIDKVEELNEVIEDLVDLRAKRLNKAVQDAFVKDLKELIAGNIDDKVDLLAKAANTDEFYLRISNYPKNNKVRRVKIRYNINFPMIYSISAIEEVFQETIINEDKLLLAYYLISIQVLNDVIAGLFKREYIVDFPESIMEKTQKRDRLTNILNNDLIKERVFIKIVYKDFEENTEYIYSLIRDGFKLAIVIDSSFKADYANLEKLNLFKYIILNKKIPTSGDVKGVSKLKDKIIELGNN